MTMQIESSCWLAFHYTPYLLTLVYDLHSEEGKGSETFFPTTLILTATLSISMMLLNLIQ